MVETKGPGAQRFWCHLFGQRYEADCSCLRNLVGPPAFASELKFLGLAIQSKDAGWKVVAD